jgi:hypothetical protein
MSNNDSAQMLLSQSKEKYVNFIENKDSDVLVEAGELLWESLKAHLAKITNTKTSNIKTLTKTASQMGEVFNELFFYCYHFHSWYLGDGISNDYIAEKKLYLQSVDEVEQIIQKAGLPKTIM